MNTRNSFSKLAYLCIIYLFSFSSLVTAQNQLITTWQTDIVGPGCTSCIILGLQTGYTGNYDVDWDNDGVFDEFGLTTSIEHDFGTPGTYTIQIQGDFPGVFTNQTKLISLDQWGDIQWPSMKRFFEGCNNLIYNAVDAPNLSIVTDMNLMFHKAYLFDGDLSNWDVSTVTNMSNTFREASTFNGDVSTWDVSNVENMIGLFYDAIAFNGDLSSWDVSGAVFMSGMFYNVSLFNSDISAWDVSNVEQIRQMFLNASSFNSDISNWNVSSVLNMSQMFQNATSFNRDLSNWDITSVTSIYSIFAGATAFNGNVSTWNLSGITSTSSMFYNATAFNGDISSWDVSSTTNMSSMFNGASSFNGDISNWDVSNVFNAFNMFQNSGISQRNYDEILNSWSMLAVNSNVNLGTVNLEYCFGEEGRNILTNDYSWVISSDLKLCPNPTALETDNCFANTGIDISSASGNNTEFVYFYDSSDDIICAINANGNDLGMTTPTVFISSTQRVADIPYINRDVEIIVSNVPSSDVTVRFYYSADEFLALQNVDASVLSPLDLGFMKTEEQCNGVFSGTGVFLEQTNNGIYNDDNDIYVETAVPSFSNFHLQGEGLILPVELTAFTAERKNNSIALEWQTQSEVNNLGFEIQRSQNSKSWKTLSFIDGKGTTNDLQNYSFLDEHPIPGDNYYRLKQIDLDGQLEYSEIRFVNLIPGKSKIYPNPADQFIYVSTDAEFDFIIYDTQMKVVARGKKKENNIDLSELEQGLYILILKQGTQQDVIRFTKI